MRILHIGNGRAFKIKAIVDAFLGRGHELHMVPIPPVTSGWPGVTWHALPSSRLPGVLGLGARCLALRRLARDLNPDVVHAHNAWGPGWYGAATGVHPFVIHAYGGDLLPERYLAKPMAQRRLTSWACRVADRVIVTGRHMVEASAGLDFPRDRLMVLPRGVDLTRYRPGLDTAPLRASLSLGPAAPIVFSPRYQIHETLYNLDIVIDAFAAVRQRFPHAVCLQMYDPAQETARRKLVSAAEARGLGDSYRLVPAVDNTAMPLFYNLANAVVSVPSTDGFPVSVLEAAACEAPIVVSRLPFCSEWFEEGVNGLIVPVRDPNALAEAVARLCSDVSLAKQLGAAGRRRVVDQADYHRCMDALEREYVALIDRRRARPA